MTNQMTHQTPENHSKDAQDGSKILLATIIIGVLIAITW